MSSASFQTKKDAHGKITGYVVRWRNPTGVKPRQPKKTFKKDQKKLAERFFAAVQYRLTAGEVGVPLESQLTLEEFYLKHYLPNRERETEDKTNEGRASHWEKWIQPNIGSMRVARIKPVHIFTLEQKIIAEGKFETAGRVRSLLNHVYGLAVSLQVVEMNPTSGLPKLKTPKRDDKWLSKDDVRRIIEGADKYSRPIVLMMAWTGLRIGEVAALNVENVNLDTGLLGVEASLSSVSKRHRKGPRTKRKATKTVSGKRLISMPSELVEVLRPLVDGRGKKEPVFTSPKGCRLDTSHFRRRDWGRVIVRANAPEWATPHDLRHHVASVLFEMNINEMKIAAYLGHKNSDITRRIYGHLLSEDTQVVADALSGAELISSILSNSIGQASGSREEQLNVRQ